MAKQDSGLARHEDQALRMMDGAISADQSNAASLLLSSAAGGGDAQAAAAAPGAAAAAVPAAADAAPEPAVAPVAFPDAARNVMDFCTLRPETRTSWHSARIALASPLPPRKGARHAPAGTARAASNSTSGDTGALDCIYAHREGRQQVEPASHRLASHAPRTRLAASPAHGR